MSAKVYQLVTDQIISQLEKGVVPWRKSWTGAGLGQCKNLISQKPYTGANAFITALADRSSPFFLTYNQANEIGAQVRKGEKSIPIVFWSKFESKEKTDKNGDPEKIGFLKVFHVFSVEQVDGLSDKLKKLCFPELKQSEFTPIEACEKVVALMPQPPKIQHAEQRAYYSQHLDYVNMPVPESFTGPEEYYSTLFHELGHSTGHETRLNRKTLTAIASFGSHTYSKEELVAEMTAAFLCAKTGISGAVIANQAAYLQGWLKVLKGDPKLVISAASQAQHAADFVLAVKP